MTDADEPSMDLEDGPYEVAAEQATDRPLSGADVFDLLASRRRRYTLHYLKQRREPVDVRELAEQVAAWENGVEVADLTSKERKRVYIALYQSHLPTMAKEGIVEYDADRGVVELTSALRDVDVYMEVVPKDDVPWNVYYLGLATADALLLLLAWLAVYPFSAVPDLVWAVFVLVTFGLSAFVQTYFNRRMRLGDEGPPPELKRRTAED